MTETGAPFRVATAARRARMTPRTLRYYDEIGLLPATTRSGSGQRLYSNHDVARLRRIDQLRESVGLSLAEIREWLGAEAVREGLRDRYHHAQDPETRRRAVEEAMKVLERQLTVVRRKRALLESLEAEYMDRLQRMSQVLAEGATQHDDTQPEVRSHRPRGLVSPRGAIPRGTDSKKPHRQDGDRADDRLPR